jgi:hypothetical protein
MKLLKEYEAKRQEQFESIKSAREEAQKNYMAMAQL